MTPALRRWWWLLPAALLIAGLARVRLDTEVLTLLPRSVPAVRGLQLFQKHFINSRELILTVRAPDAEAAGTAARLLAEALRSESQLVAGVLWQPPWLEHPDQMAQFIAYLWLNQHPASVAQLTNRLAPQHLDAVAAESRNQLATSLSPTDIARLGYDPFGLTRIPETTQGDLFLRAPEEGFASADGTFRAIFVEAQPELAGYRTCARWLAAVQAVVDRASNSTAWPKAVVVRSTGSPVFVAEIATSMAGDIQFTVLTTLALIGILFWWAHRSWRPLCWLMVMLLLVMAGALAAGGLIFGTLNAVSLGFGAILLGLGVDCGLVVYQEAAAEPHRSAADLRRSLVPSVLWSSLTTASAFLLLNFAGLPGLSQLGTIVGIGVLLAPLVMMFLFLPLALRWLRKLPPRTTDTPRPTPKPRAARVATVVIAVLAALAVWRASPGVDRSNSPIEPRNSQAQLALDELQASLNRQREPLLVVLSGRDESEVADKLTVVQQHLDRVRTNGLEFSALLPGAVWPHPDWQRTNAPALATLAGEADAIHKAAARAGFTPDAMELAGNLFREWTPHTDVTGLWPTNESCRWLLRRAAAWTGTNWLAAGAVYPESDAALSRFAEQIDPNVPGVWVAGWRLLGGSLFRHVERRVFWMMLAIVAVVALCLRLAFRRWAEVVLSFGALTFMLLGLQAVLGLAGASWNLMSLAALPLLLGVGVDYIIHVQVALRRHHGDVGAMRRVTGKAILLCAATNVDGFGSNVLSSNPGLASLGLVCAIGITIAYGTAVFLLPAWWLLFRPAPDRAQNGTGHALAHPSAIYGPQLWRLGCCVARLLPRAVCRALGLLGTSAYRWMRPERFRVIEENLLPVFRGDRFAARTAARRLLSNFSGKLADLLRIESGATDGIPISTWSGYDVLEAALNRRQGVLLVTAHLGNWEFGGCLLAAKGVRLLVLTQAEPGRGFTELRGNARARRGIETFVIGQDAFAFVDVIKRLEDGATVALLVDRPPTSSAVTVELFGRPFQASIAPAELARASGAALVPVYVVAEGNAYAAHVLPEIAYDRREIGDRDARRRLSGEILRAFEPVIRQHADQWYHFVPVWKDDAPGHEN